MFILNRKKIIFISSVIILSIFFSCTNTKNSLELASSTPVSNHIVILDAGHGNPDGGAVGQDGSIESNLNLEIVLKLQKLLEASNCTVILTRSDEDGIYETTAETIRYLNVSNLLETLQIKIKKSIAKKTVVMKVLKIWERIMKDIPNARKGQSFLFPNITA